MYTLFTVAAGSEINLASPGDGDRWSQAKLNLSYACRNDHSMRSSSLPAQPTLMARLALAYPKPPPDDEHQSSSPEDTKETNGHAHPADVESGANSRNGTQ